MDIRDVRIDTMSTSPAVKATHIPTGQNAVIYASESQRQNRKLAIETLAALVDRLEATAP